MIKKTEIEKNEEAESIFDKIDSTKSGIDEKYLDNVYE
jgi:hypothetical protein